MKRAALLSTLLLSSIALAAFPSRAEQTPDAALAGAGASVGEALDAIRDDLLALRFERVQAGVEALLETPDLDADSRAEALILRTQAEVAVGDLAAAERGFEAILRLRPAYVPDAAVTPRKALERFEKVQAKLIGRVALRLDPPEALVSVDGNALAAAPAGALPLLAGEHLLRAEYEGHDPEEARVTVVAGAEVAAELLLSPNSRTVVLLTEPEGVEVRLDGQVAGHTARRAGSSGPAELVLERLPLGEHLFELAKSCYRTEQRRELLAVDFLDRSPRRLGPIVLAPARSALLLEGGPAGAEVSLDGRPVGRLPIERLEACPGPVELELRVGARVIWRSREFLRDGEDERVGVAVRPNAVVLGADGWPEPLAAWGRQFNTVALPDVPAADPAPQAAHPAVSEADLVVGVTRAVGDGVAERWLLQSPLLHRAAPLSAPPAQASRPSWRTWAFGAVIADGTVAGPLTVVAVEAGSAAATAGVAVGDRIVALDGKEMKDAATFAAALGAIGPEGQARVRFRSLKTREFREVAWIGRPVPKLHAIPRGWPEAAALAAWAAADAEGRGDPAALVNLAWLLAAFDRSEAAVEALRRLRPEQDDGPSPGVVRYLLGRELERLGREDEAVEAYRAAAASDAVWSPGGPPVAPAARDRLADLGVR